MYSNGYKILLENYDFQDNTYIACYKLDIILLQKVNDDCILCNVTLDWIKSRIFEMIYLKYLKYGNIF